jgi:ubiquinone/menaquinone biosynthesis C-methylase UbiE/DNA-binding transcriptional ArsR family regulator
VSATVRCLKALADPTRLRLVRVLSQYELAVNEVVRLFDMGQSRISRHLTILAQSGLVSSRREGLWVYYRASGDSTWRPIISALEALESTDAEQRAATVEDRRRAAAVVDERSRTTRQFFDARASEWDRLAREVLGDLDLAAEVGAVLVGIADQGDVAVDVGCGTGALLEVLAARVGRTIGVDSSPRMLERARKRFEARAGVELRLGEAEHLPLGDGEARLAVISMTLHHLAEPAAGLREAARVVGSGGFLAVAELGRHEREDLRDAHGDRWLGFDRDELVAMARSAGFRLKREQRHELPRGLGLGVYLFQKTRGGKKNGQREDLRGS